MSWNLMVCKFWAVKFGSLHCFVFYEMANSAPSFWARKIIVISAILYFDLSKYCKVTIYWDELAYAQKKVRPGQINNRYGCLHLTVLNSLELRIL